ncbi:Na/Pi-cotransporter [Shimia abyssi]|uniref:Na/Pi-cotransporter n=1 Tax=Shimia abyssi TaxID=1662395 RepID=A0A2P8F6C9_9RHOB|nr:Na/Pi-cotransporter [Shimia abyssi]
MLEIAVSVAAAVVLFVYALKGFSEDVQTAGGEALKSVLARLTRTPVGGFALGAVLTALVQSSSAISGITVALAEAGTIAFRGTLPVFLGANVGTTSTAWLVTINATILAPILIVASVVASLLPGRIALYGRSIMYLGVILLALNLISGYVAPLKDDPDVALWMGYLSNPVAGFVAGAIATALLQSSSVVVGLAIIAVQQELITMYDVLPIVVGSNIGTTSTALIASMSLGATARAAAVANLAFNALGVIVFVPFMAPVASWVSAMAGEGDMAVALIHLIFNVCVAVTGFVALRPLAKRLDPDETTAKP